MPSKNNPFKPTQPVYSGMFAGRVDEIRRIETVLFETKDCNPTNLLIVGERGIGKTSLLLFSRYLAIGAIPFNEGKFNFFKFSYL
jgi:Cdc6-like AAA superfamily ATPase